MIACPFYGKMVIIDDGRRDALSETNEKNRERCAYPEVEE